MQPLSKQFNAAVLTMAGLVLPRGFDVLDDAPQTFEALQGYYDKTGRVAVWSGASDHTIFADREVNYAFRAWHDANHLRFAQPFTLAGEMIVADLQKGQLEKRYGKGRYTDFYKALIEMEVVGQAEYFAEFNKFPEDQMEFALGYMRDNRIVNPFETAPAPRGPVVPIACPACLVAA